MAIGRLTRTIRRLTAQGCFVVVFAHWNYEFLDLPAPSNRRFAHRMVDAGAHLVVGSHPHVIQGHETYKGRSIFHSLGNFVFRQISGVADPRLNETFVLTVDVDRSLGYDVHVHPVRTTGRGIALLADEDRLRVLERLERISAPLGDAGGYRRAFYEQASGGAERISGEIRAMVKDQGLMYLLSRLHRVTLQDIQIKLHSVMSRQSGRTVEP